MVIYWVNMGWEMDEVTLLAQLPQEKLRDRVSEHSNYTVWNETFKDVCPGAVKSSDKLLQ